MSFTFISNPHFKKKIEVETLPQGGFDHLCLLSETEHYFLTHYIISRDFWSHTTGMLQFLRDRDSNAKNHDICQNPGFFPNVWHDYGQIKAFGDVINNRKSSTIQFV